MQDLRYSYTTLILKVSVMRTAWVPVLEMKSLKESIDS